MTERMSFKERVRRHKTGLKIAQEIYEQLNARWSTNPHVMLWRQSYRAIDLINQASLWIRRDPIDYGVTIDDRVMEWRKSSKVGYTISSQVMAFAVRHKAFTLSEIEVACQGYAGRTAIKSVLKTGVEMELLTRDDKTHRYLATDRLIENAYHRMIVKMLDPRIVEFSRFVVMFDEARKNAEATAQMESKGEISPREFETLAQALFYNDYDSEIFGGDDDDDAQ
jgi:hypothetical protein